MSMGLAKRATFLAFLALNASTALAHGPLPRDGGIVLARGWDALVAGLLLTCGALYAIGAVRKRGTRLMKSWAPSAFAAGWLTLAVALLPPVSELSPVLFSVHMAQHALLVLVAAPLLALGKPMVLMLWAFPLRARLAGAAWARTNPIGRCWRALTRPFTAWLLHGAVLWTWHIPVFYEAALRSEAVHALEHTSFFASAGLFWWALLYGRYGRKGYGMSVLYLFATAVHTGLLGALMTFSSRVWYPTYEQRALGGGVGALADQQIGGLIMWIPGGVVFTIAGLAIFAAWLTEAERRMKKGGLSTRDCETRNQPARTRKEMDEMTKAA